MDLIFLNFSQAVVFPNQAAQLAALTGFFCTRLTGRVRKPETKFTGIRSGLASLHRQFGEPIFSVPLRLFPIPGAEVVVGVRSSGESL